MGDVNSDETQYIAREAPTDHPERMTRNSISIVEEVGTNLHPGDMYNHRSQLFTRANDTMRHPMRMTQFSEKSVVDFFSTLHSGDVSNAGFQHNFDEEIETSHPNWMIHKSGKSIADFRLNLHVNGVIDDKDKHSCRAPP